MAVKAMIDDALRYIGMKNGRQDEEMVQRVEETFGVLEKILQPRSVYRIFEVHKDGQKVMLESTSCTIESRDLSRLLKSSRKCVVLAATLGIKADQEIAKRQRLNMLDALIFDACCSVLIDKVCDEIEEELMEKLKEGEFLTMRYSPGYGDVPLEVSGEILALVDAPRRIGLTQTESQMLVPTKSITALIGISAQRENREKSCGRCNLVKSCSYRKRGDRCGL